MTPSPPTLPDPLVTVETPDGAPVIRPPEEPTTWSRRWWLVQVRDGAIVTTVSALLTAWIFRVWDIPLRLPFLYQRDGIAQIAEVKSIIETGWYQYNPRVGWPVGYDHHDFPIGADNLQWLAIKVLGWFSHDAVLVTNLYYLGTFVLVALTSFFVVRYLGASRRMAFVVAMLYTFLPYHFLRGTWHLTLSGYFMVPIACLLCVMVWRQAPPFFAAVDGPDGTTRVRFQVKRLATVWLVIACLVIASTGVYYAAFLGTLLLTTGAVRLLMAREWRPLASGVILIAVIGFGLVVNLSPSILYWRDHGKNEAVAQRSVEESDFYALRPIQMLSPIPGYRIDALGKITNRVFRAPNNSEAAQFLGVIGALGFLGLLALLLAGVGRRDRDRSPPLLFRLAALTATAVIFGVTGGFSWVLGFAGLKEIRAWNRISVFIAFFALVAVALFLDRVIARTREFPHKRLAAGAFAMLLVGIGIFDQTSKAIVPDSSRFAAEWNSDAVFVEEIEQHLGPGKSVFQLPYLPFPEGELDVPPYGMVDYDPLRGYVHSRDLSWGYGGVKGREADWQAQVVQLPTPEMLAATTAVGFRGLWIDRFGYPGRAAQIEDEVQAATGQAPIVSPNGRFAFYDLRDYARQVRAELGTAGARELRAETLADFGR